MSRKTQPSRRRLSVSPAGAAEVPVPSRRARALVRRLLRWFAQNARDLPWRRTRDPYAIWVAEVMLQQTQVRTVVPYWRRWMRALPTVQALAQARPARVLKLWEGLGYYRRARHLHQAARRLVAEHGGRFPETPEELRTLPGVGRYTAGAISSIAFNQPTPVVDGNVTRVLSRLFAVDGKLSRTKAQQRLWRLAEALVRQAAAERADYLSRRTRGCAGNCSMLNQALMELGAVVCTPRQPRCAACPVRALCEARRHGRVQELPRLGPRPATRARHFVAFVLERAGRFLVRKRPAEGVNGHLWEFPNVEVGQPHFDARAVARGCVAVVPAVLKPLGTLRHTITTSAITLHVFYGRLAGRSRASLPRDRWLTREGLARRALPSAHRRVMESLGHLARSLRQARLASPRAAGRRRNFALTTVRLRR